MSKLFQLPVSDCGCFVGGIIDASIFEKAPEDVPWPACGIIVWYESEDACREAMQAAMKAHWPEAPDGTMTAPTPDQPATEA